MSFLFQTPSLQKLSIIPLYTISQPMNARANAYKITGPQALSNAELLAIILRTGTTRNNVIELSGILLSKFGGLGGLMRADFMELCKEYGLGRLCWRMTRE